MPKESKFDETMARKIMSRKKEQSSLPSWNHTVCLQNTAACSECTGLKREIRTVKHPAYTWNTRTQSLGAILKDMIGSQNKAFRKSFSKRGHREIIFT